MGKISHLTISTITALGLVAPTVSPGLAFAEPGNLDNGWTAAELIVYEDEFNAMLDDECGEDNVCKGNIRVSYLFEPTEFSALISMKEQRLLVTAVDPMRETIKVVYFDEDPMMGMGNTAPLSKLYLNWFDSWEEQIYAYNYSQFISGTVPGTHTVYDAVSTLEPVVPANREVELSVAGSGILGNTAGKFGLIAESNNYNVSGAVNYSDCLSSPDYSEGMICELRLSPMIGQKFVPAVAPVEDTSEPEPDPADTEPEPDPTDTEPEPTDTNPDPEPSLEPEPSPTNTEPDPDPTSSDTDPEPSPANDISDPEPTSGTDDSNSEPTSGITDSASEPTTTNDEPSNPEPIAGTPIASVKETVESSASARANESSVSVEVADSSITTHPAATGQSTIVTTSTSAVSGETTSTNSQRVLSNNTVSTPITGDAEGVAGFPWWVLLIFATGLLLLIWWICPVGRKKSEKN